MPLTGSLNQFFSECGVMKVVAEAAYKAGKGDHVAAAVAKTE
jgi:hypothetical protein